MSLLPFLQLPSGPREEWWPLAEELAVRIREAIEEGLPENATDQDMGARLASLSKQTGIQLMNIMMILNGRYNITLKEITALETALSCQLIYVPGFDDEDEWEPGDKVNEDNDTVPDSNPD